jgi:serine/threonine-protein phosphatase 2A regulatory subunit A
MRDELIPYLIEIVEEMDNDNDFLIKVAEQLLEMKPLCRDISETYILIPPLKILAALDQPVVREKAVISLQKLCDGQSKIFFKKHFYPLIREMAAEEAYPSRVSVCGLIPICYPNVEPELQSDLRNIFSKLALN